MELKRYQKSVIADLNKYLAQLTQTKNLDIAYTRFWEEKGIPVGFGKNEVPPYQNTLPGIPNVCLKIPTGGGKTFLACNAIRPIFDALPDNKIKAVVWLVPSDSILTQTLNALRNPGHPYRQKINADFGGCVEVYTKQELLSGQNFNITSVSGQLSIMILSYDSFRGRPDTLKARQENGYLTEMAKTLGEPENPIEDADETSLIQIINQLSPLVIVDESHHAISDLSKEMLINFNPCFVLDLTATPTKESNVICYVDAAQLKRENMVKLPVIVYNRSDQQEVIADAIDLRDRLEEQACEERQISGRYIRPIVLFQAQTRGKEDNTTFEKLKDKLVKAGIPSKQIAIQTSEKHELDGVDLLSEDCEIRYIITVNALKEGWDCSFAYILASIANKNSRIDVEQIVGRILRQPYVKRLSKPALNMSYVLTSSNDFKDTLDEVVNGLNYAGFSEKDYRVGKILDAQYENTKPGTNDSEYNKEDIIDTNSNDVETGTEEFLDFDSKTLEEELNKRSNNKAANSGFNNVSAMLEQAQNEQEEMDLQLAEEKEDSFDNISTNPKNKGTRFYMNPEFEKEAKEIRIPQFFLNVESSLFTDGYTVKLSKDLLGEGFTLKGQPYPTDFDNADDKMAKIDIDDTTGNTPRVFKLSETDQRYMKEQFSRYSPEQKIRTCKDIIHRNLNQIDAIDAEELRDYVDLIVDQIARTDSDTLTLLENKPQEIANHIKKFVQQLLENYYENQFYNWIEMGKIVCKPSFSLPSVIMPLRSSDIFGGSLYQAEEEVNDFEYDMVMALTGMDNVKWWHRNISQREFCLNGFINHYPDFIVMTKKGRIVLIETKGDQLENTESRQKLSLGRTWQNATSDEFRYYMVFQSKDLKMDGAYQFEKFLDLMKAL